MDDTQNIEVNENSQEKTGVTVDTIFDSIAQDTPEVQEHAIKAHEEKEEQAQSEYKEHTDTLGNTFDPAIHRTKADGTPDVTKSGKLRFKTGMKQKLMNGSVSVVGAPNEEEKINRAKSRATGKGAATLLIQVGTTIGGEEWRPITNAEYGIDERLALESAFGDYFEATGKTDFPPAMALSFAIVGYALPRFTMPKTRSKVSGLGGWIKKKYVSWRARSAAKKYGVTLEESEAK